MAVLFLLRTNQESDTGEALSATRLTFSVAFQRLSLG